MIQKRKTHTNTLTGITKKVLSTWVSSIRNFSPFFFFGYVFCFVSVENSNTGQELLLLLFLPKCNQIFANDVCVYRKMNEWMKSKWEKAHPTIIEFIVFFSFSILVRIIIIIVIKLVWIYYSHTNTIPVLDFQFSIFFSSKNRKFRLNF